MKVCETSSIPINTDTQDQKSSTLASDKSASTSISCTTRIVAAFDIGIKNFAFAVKNGSEFAIVRHINLVEDIPLTSTELNKLKKDAIIQMMNDLSVKDETIRRFVAIDKESKESFCKRKPKIVHAIYKHNRRKYSNHYHADRSLFEVMDSYNHIWQECDVFLLERQMLTNRQALKMGHYLEAYLKLRHPGKRVVNYNASFKTKKLGAPPSQTKPERKRWTVDYAGNLLEGEVSAYFQQLPKKDDVADTICMIQAFHSSNNPVRRPSAGLPFLTR